MQRSLPLLAVLAGLALGGCATHPSTTPLEDPMSASPLHGARLVGFAATTDAARCRAFYEKKLGLRVASEDSLAIVLDANGQMIRIQKLKQHTPQHFTILGWNVDDLAATVTRLEAAGIRCKRVPGVPQDERGIVDFPDGTRLVWLDDPDANILSVAQMPR